MGRRLALHSGSPALLNKRAVAVLTKRWGAQAEPYPRVPARPGGPAPGPGLGARGRAGQPAAQSDGRKNSLQRRFILLISYGIVLWRRSSHTVECVLFGCARRWVFTYAPVGATVSPGNLRMLPSLPEEV